MHRLLETAFFEVNLEIWVIWVLLLLPSSADKNTNIMVRQPIFSIPILKVTELTQFFSLFQNSVPNYEDFVSKGAKLHTQLK